MKYEILHLKDFFPAVAMNSAVSVRPNLLH